MTLAAGSRLGPYEITGAIGAGGMGEVYRATDTKLKREVAIKVLPAAFVADKERLARFEREAQLLAQLHHPHIASIFGLEESGESPALVMELVEGLTLAERLAEGPIPVDEALPIARQIAEALEYAHEQGVIHRDLKPANIKLTNLNGEDQVKVLDFGLAKAMDPGSGVGGAPSSVDLSHSPTMTLGGTVQGMILGTAGYMAPEQARGSAVDKRADIWAFGVVLYEMLSGQRLFAGESVPDALAGVLKGEIDLETLPDEVPAALRRLLRRCLERHPKHRLRDIGEARIALDAIAAGESEEVPDAVPEPIPAGRRALWFGLVGGAVLGALIVLGALRLGGGSLTAAGAAAAAESPRPVKFRIELPDGTHLGHAQISPDGRAIAWDSGNALWVRNLDRFKARRIALPWPAVLETWTRDSRELVVVRQKPGTRYLWRVSASGGDPKPIGSLPDEGFLWGVAQGPDGNLVIGMATAGLFTIPLSGGSARPLLAAENGESFTGPSWLPGGRVLLFAEVQRGRIEALVNGKRKVILERKGERYFDPLYSPSGHLIVRVTGGRSARGTWAVPFSLDRLATTGEPFRVLPYGIASISDDGTLVVGELQEERSPERLVEVGRKGKVLKAIGDSLIDMRDPALSPDGRRVVVSAGGGYGDPSSDLFVVDRSNGARYRLTDDLGNDIFPAWSRDGKDLFFETFNAGIRYARSRAADGSGELRLLSNRALCILESPDGRYLVTSFFKTRYREKGTDAWREFFNGMSLTPDFSPDGKWFAYRTGFGPAGISLRRFPSGEGLTPVSSERATNPRFGRDGKELYFLQNGSLVSVPVDLAGETAKVGVPRKLFDLASAHLDPEGGFDITPKGMFLMVQRLDKGAAKTRPDGILVDRDWFREFSANASGGRP